MHKISFLIFMLLSLSVSATDLKALYQEAVKSDPKWLAALANFEAEKEKQPQAWAKLLPQISLNYDRKSFKKKEAGGVVLDDYNSETTTLNLTQAIYRKDLFVDLDLAEKSIIKARIEMKDAEQDLMLRLSEAYFSVLSAQDSVELKESEVKAVSLQLKQVKKRLSVGMIAITDVHEVEARYDLSNAELIFARNELDQSFEMLREIAVSAGLDIARLTSDQPIQAYDSGLLSDWLDKTRAGNYQLMSARSTLEIAREKVRKEKSSFSPTLDLVASKSSLRDDRLYDPDLESTYENDSTSIELKLVVPLFSGGYTSSKVREARHLVRSAEMQLEETRRSVIRKTRDAYTGLKAASARVTALKLGVKSAETAKRAIEVGIKVGTRTSVELLDAQSAWYKARYDYQRARYEHALNVIRLEKEAGVLTSSSLERIHDWLKS